MILREFTRGREASLKLIFLVVFLLLLGIFFTVLQRHLLRISKHKDCAVSYENGELNDYTKPFNRIKGLKIENIKSISYWGKQKKVSQYKVQTTASDPKSNELMNQLKGRDFYLTDSLVDSNELIALIELVADDVAKRTS